MAGMLSIQTCRKGGHWYLVYYHDLKIKLYLYFNKCSSSCSPVDNLGHLRGLGQASLQGDLPSPLFWLLPHAGKWGKNKCDCWWSLCSPAPRAASGGVCFGNHFFCIWNSLTWAAWSLGWWIRIVIVRVISVSVWELEILYYYFKGKILNSALQPGGIRLEVSECLKTFTPTLHVLGEQRETPTTDSVVLMGLLCNDLRGLHHPGSQLFGSPWRNSVSISNCLLKPHKGWV